MSFIVFENVNIDNITDEISVSTSRNYSSNDYVGDTGGSETFYISESGKVLSFSNLLPSYQITDSDKNKLSEYLSLKERFKQNSGVLTCESKSSINGNYIITDFSYTEDTMHNFIMNWEFTEQVQPNITASTFRVWNVPTTTSTTTSTTTTTTTTTTSGGLSSTTKYLLTKCGTLKYGNKGTCVKYLQRFLRTGGYYTKYKLDGQFGVYTRQELKKLQKKLKLSQTGAWDTKTRNYYRTKYKKYL